MDLVQIAVKCPRCGSKFNTLQVSAWFDTGMRNSELRQDFAGGAPQMEQYAVCTCPACRKSDWMSQFPAINEPAVLNQANLIAHVQFRTAAVAAQQDRHDYYNAGILYLYAAWCADDSKAYPQAQEYRRCAIESFARALNDVSCPLNERRTVEYLIGELYRRTGDFAAAQSHLNSVLPHLPGKLAYMARKIIKLATFENSELSTFDTPG
jgi:uncharacterized protein (DUF2225 family)